MNQDKNKVQVVIRAVNLVVCGAFLCISIIRVNKNQGGFILDLDLGPVVSSKCCFSRYHSNESKE